MEALEMWSWRKMEKISYKERITKEEVLTRVGEQRTTIETIMARKKKWIGHNLKRLCPSVTSFINKGLTKDVIE